MNSSFFYVRSESFGSVSVVPDNKNTQPSLAGCFCLVIINKGMRTIFAILIVILAVMTTQAADLEIIVPVSTRAQHVGTVKSDLISIRLLILKHCFQSIADGDANSGLKAADLGRTKGLKIKDIGNYYLTKEGKSDKRVAWGKFQSVEEIKSFVSEQMKITAEPGDTFFIYTIGHGAASGDLQLIGQRQILVDAFSQAAEENNQETFWWQLSCHAAAGLPQISTLNPKQQELFSMLPSSPANEVSYFDTQGQQLEKLFTALAEGSREIDPNQDCVVVAQELKDFLNKAVKPGRGDLLYARAPDEPIFGFNLANSIPIKDRNSPQKDYPKDYIPMPRR